MFSFNIPLFSIDITVLKHSKSKLIMGLEHRQFNIKA